MSDAARLESLDVFRGLTIAGMILVSTPGTWTAVYAPLVHAAVAWLTEHTSQRTQVAAAAIALFGYWLLLLVVPVPGFGAGVLTPAGNLASYVDRLLLGRHLLTAVYDPEGLLSTVPAIA